MLASLKRTNPLLVSLVAGEKPEADLLKREYCAHMPCEAMEELGEAYKHLTNAMQLLGGRHKDKHTKCALARLGDIRDHLRILRVLEAEYQDGVRYD